MEVKWNDMMQNRKVGIGCCRFVDCYWLVLFILRGSEVAGMSIVQLLTSDNSRDRDASVLVQFFSSLWMDS